MKQSIFAQSLGDFTRWEFNEARDKRTDLDTLTVCDPENPHDCETVIVTDVDATVQAMASKNLGALVEMMRTGERVEIVGPAFMEAAE